MAKLRDVVAYVAMHYPYKSELSKARLTKMVYLADWRSAILYGSQITSIQWEFNHYGPYVEDVVKVARNDSDFSIKQTSTMYGDPKDVISVATDAEFESLSEHDRAVLDFVIGTVSPKNWNDFIRLVYSTFPIVTQPRHSKLNLVELAQRYKGVASEISSE